MEADIALDAFVARPSQEHRHARDRVSVFLIGPGVVLLLVFFALPICALLARSVFDPTPTLANFRLVFASHAVFAVFTKTIWIALVSTVIALCLAYPVAYVLLRARPNYRIILLAAVLLPFWTNILARCYSLMLVLQTTGVFNQSLIHIGVLKDPLPIMFNFTGVVIGMVHYLIPPAALILYSSMQNVDLRLVAVAETLGATPWAAFAKVFFPLSLPGLRSTTVLIFTTGLGFFVTPAVLGGQRETTISMLIQTQFSETLNWGFGAALAAVLMLTTSAGIVLYYSTTGRSERRWTQ